MKLKRFCAGLAALCMVCAVVPVLPMQESAVISANAYGELTYEDLLYTTGKMRQDDTEIEYVTIAGVTDKETVTKINIPAEIDGLPVKSIKDSAFKDCTALTTVTMPDTIFSIGNNVFEGCTALTSITIPNGVMYIQYRTFAGCTNLKSVTLPDSVEQFGDEVFSGCESLTSITLPDGVARLGMSGIAFSGCPNLATIKVSENNTHFTVEDGILFSKDKRELLFYPPKNPKTEYTVPDDVSIIKRYAFSGCSALTSVVISDSVKTIEGGAFSGCANLGSITIPKSVTDISSSSFENTLWLEEKKKENPLVVVNGILIDGTTCTGDIVIPDGVKYIPRGVFGYMNEKITSIVMPDSVTSIDRLTFEYLSSLKSVTLSKNLTKIEAGLFNHCSSLVSIIIPESVTAIEYDGGYDAFENCEKLEAITIMNPNCEISDRKQTIFNGYDENGECYFNGTIYGYEGSTAQAYAEKYGYKFALIGSEPKTEELKQGDADGNGEIDILDVITINKAIMGKENLSENGLKAIDFNGNSKPDSDEAMQILKFIVGLITSFES